MAISFVIDEHLRIKLLAAIHQHNATGRLLIDATQVGDPPDLPLGTVDPDLLVWAEQHDHIVVSLDRNTLIGYFYAHLAAGRHLPGLFVVRRGAPLGQIVSFLEIATHACGPDDFIDQVTYIP